jgi:hypothetical protein
MPHKLALKKKIHKGVLEKLLGMGVVEIYMLTHAWG